MGWKTESREGRGLLLQVWLWLGAQREGLWRLAKCVELPLVLALALGSPPSQARGEPPATSASIYDRTTNWFAGAVFMKPSGGVEGDLTSQLAPLILQEVAGPEADGAPGFAGPTKPVSRFTGGVSTMNGAGFGCLTLTNSRLALDAARPTIYASLDQVRIGGRTHVRVAYVWCYSVEPREERAQPALPLQGIRITLNSNGRPAVWEVLADDSRCEVLFVSQALEGAAEAHFGKALPGRRYAVERAAADGPSVLVAGVVEEASTVLGAIVYLNGRAHDVNTVMCRCTASQVRRLAATSSYSLVLAEGAAEAALAAAKAQTSSQTAFWPGDDGQRVQRCLRLPADF